MAEMDSSSTSQCRMPHPSRCGVPGEECPFFSCRTVFPFCRGRVSRPDCHRPLKIPPPPLTCPGVPTKANVCRHGPCRSGNLRRAGLRPRRNFPLPLSGGGLLPPQLPPCPCRAGACFRPTSPHLCSAGIGTVGNACAPPLLPVILSERSESKDPLSLAKQKSGAVRMDGPAGVRLCAIMQLLRSEPFEIHR